MRSLNDRSSMKVLTCQSVQQLAGKHRGINITEQEKMHTGGCMCGAIRYEAIGKTKFIINCHCHSCRKHTGAPMVTFVAFKKEQVNFTQGERNCTKALQWSIEPFVATVAHR